MKIYRLADIGKGFLAVMAYPVIACADNEPFAELVQHDIGHVVSLLETGEACSLGLANSGGVGWAGNLFITMTQNNNNDINGHEEDGSVTHKGRSAS